MNCCPGTGQQSAEIVLWQLDRRDHRQLKIILKDVELTVTRQIEVPLANEVATYWPVKEPPHHE
jgi:hypothetical protein